MKADLKEKYQLVFNSPIGQEVLADILVNKLNFGCYLKEALGDVSLHNAAIAILSEMGIVEVGNGEQVIKALMVISTRKADKNKEELR